MYGFVKSNIWVFYIFFILLGTSLLHAFTARLIRHLTIKIEKNKIIFPLALLKSISVPIGFLIWLSGFSFIFSIILTQKKYLFFAANFSELKKIGITIILCWILVRFIHHAEALYLDSCSKQNKNVDRTLVHALRQLLTIIISIIGLLLIMQIMNIPVAGLLAFGGIGGAGIALAAKDLLANFFGGLVIYMDRPFKVGDWIRSPDKNIEGVVEYIGWRMTRIRTFDKRPLYVPNGIFLTISVENPSRMLHRRIKSTIGIRYQDADKIDIITKQIRTMLLEHKAIDNSQLLTVSLVEFGASSLNILISAYSKNTKWDQFQMIQHEILMKILDIISENGAECAFPTQTLYVQQSKS